MNIFVLSEDPVETAQMQLNKHVVKMVLESAQMLCAPYETGVAPYKRAHYNHPCTIWARESYENYQWLISHALALAEEYTFRYGKEHGAGKHRKALKGLRFIAPIIPTTREPVFRQKDPLSPYTGLTAHPQCFSGHDHCKTDEDWPIIAYRAFYRVDKSSFARYNKGRNMPQWMKENCNE